MKPWTPLALILLAACVSPGGRSFAAAQRIVDKSAGRHADVVRLSIDATPRNESIARIVASNVASRIGAASDPEDLEARATKQPVTRIEGEELDLTWPVIDALGRVVAAVGVTVRGTNPAAMRARAEVVAREVSSAILAARAPLW